MSTLKQSTSERQAAFQTEVGQHRKILYKICNAYCPDRDSREDLAQQILLQLWRSFAKFDGRCKFSTWMYRISLNVAISFHRSEGARTRHVITDERILLDATDGGGEARSDELRALYGFIEELDPFDKALILLYLDGHTNKEIADIVGITETNVATKINRLKNRMKKEFHGTAND